MAVKNFEEGQTEKNLIIVVNKTEWKQITRWINQQKRAGEPNASIRGFFRNLLKEARTVR